MKHLSDLTKLYFEIYSWDLPGGRMAKTLSTSAEAWVHPWSGN